MIRMLRWPLLSLVLLLTSAKSAPAYVDLAPTLGRLVRDAQTIAVVKVDRFSSEKGAVLLKKVKDLKGAAGDEAIKHLVRKGGSEAIDQQILEWAEPGREAVLLVSGKTALVCVGQGWYQVQSGADGWWELTAPRPDLPLAFYGHVSRLAEAVELMLADKTAVITTLPHGDQEGASFDLALNRTSLPGLVRLQRIRANLRMPPMVMAVSTNPAYLIGQGAAGEDEIPALIEKLKSSDATVRAESAEDLGSLGDKAKLSYETFYLMLGDQEPLVRLAAASAAIRVHSANGNALATLAKSLRNDQPAIRRAAARACGLAGPRVAPITKNLAECLSDDDAVTRGAALQAIATLGPAAADSVEPISELLDKPDLAIQAADALGRIGPAARPAMKKLAKMLESDAPATRWAAIRAMSQIGGEEAAPAVDWMVHELRNASVVDGYNMMIYLSLLGPVAKPAIPAIQSSRVMNPVLKPATIWAIEPEKQFPWQAAGVFGPFAGSAPGGGPDFALWIYESYVNELGDRLKPTAILLAKRIMDGTAGEVPAWAYKLLAKFPTDTLPILTAGLSQPELTPRERAAVSLGYMGHSAASAKAQIMKAIEKAPDEREQKLLKWCLREIGGE